MRTLIVTLILLVLTSCACRETSRAILNVRPASSLVQTYELAVTRASNITLESGYDKFKVVKNLTGKGPDVWLVIDRFRYGDPGSEVAQDAREWLRMIH